MGSSDAAWKTWGKIDPYYGVLTFPQFRLEKIAGNRDAFFETGAESFAKVMSNIGRFFGTTPCKRALDFGCGVGRVLVPMGQHFDSVTGVDISSGMLEEARRNCDKFGLANVELIASDDKISKAASAYDLVHSHIVLQHIPVRRGLAVAERLLQLVEPGGFAMLHFSIRRGLSLPKRLAYVLKHDLPGGIYAMNCVQGKPLRYPAMQMNNYPPDRVLSLFADQGFHDVVAVPEQHPSAFTLHFYGQKAAPTFLATRAA
jgi:SAM-dependent methyltransferase